LPNLSLGNKNPSLKRTSPTPASSTLAFQATRDEAMDEEWITRNNNPRKRDRRSYDSNWGVYEARGGGNNFSGCRARYTANAAGLSAGDILVEGERVGLPHGSNGGSSVPQRAGYGYGGTNRQNGYQHQAAGYQQQQQPSRIIRADHRGSATIARGNNPPTNSCNHNTNIHPHNNFNPRPSQSNNALPPALLSSLHSSVTNPPPITVRLPPEYRSTLNNEQCSIIESILSGNSVFFTGPAGSGKSHILKNLLKANSELGDTLLTGTAGCKNIVLTATTGVAACSIGGTTIHSFAGITPNSSDGECVKRIMGNEYAKKRWRECDVLVIDEISMMGSGFLDRLNFVSGRVRNDR
jgi:hypothetical protein